MPSICFLILSTTLSGTYAIIKILLIAFAILLLLVLLYIGAKDAINEIKTNVDFTSLSQEKKLALLTQLNTLLNRNMFNQSSRKGMIKF